MGEGEEGGRKGGREVREEGGKRGRMGEGGQSTQESTYDYSAGLANLHVSVGVGVAVCKVASILCMLERIGPREAIVVCLRLCVCPPEGGLEVGDVVTCTVPAEVAQRCVHLRIHDRLHAFIVEAACLCARMCVCV